MVNFDEGLIMRIGFIGLGNVGGKLASNLFNNNFDLTVFDKDNEVLNQFKNKGTKVASSIEQLVSNNDILITCLPSPEACNEVIESSKGIAAYIKENQIWMEPVVKQLSILLISQAIMRESFQPREMEVTQLGLHFYR